MNRKTHQCCFTDLMKGICLLLFANLFSVYEIAVRVVGHVVACTCWKGSRTWYKPIPHPCLYPLWDNRLPQSNLVSSDVRACISSKRDRNKRGLRSSPDQAWSCYQAVSFGGKPNGKMQNSAVAGGAWSSDVHLHTSRIVTNIKAMKRESGSYPG